MAPQFSKLLLAGCIAFATCGCGNWKTLTKGSTELPAPKMSPDSVTLEIAVARVPSDFDDLEETLWQRVDEQHLTFDVRRRLRENGIRCALLGSQLPASLSKILEEDEAEFGDGLENSARRKEEGTWRERKQGRAGRRYKIVTTPMRDQINVLTKDGDAVRGQTCRQAHCEFAMRTYPLGDGSVRLELTPEVHFGPPRQKYVGDGNGFIIEAKQDELAFDQLRIEALLAPGQTLLLSSTHDLAGIGGQFFGDPDSDNAKPKLVLIRLAHSQNDDLYDQEEVLSPIATSAD